MEEHPTLRFRVVAIEKEAFGSPSTTVTYFRTIVFVYNQLNVKTVQLFVKTVLFQTIQFSISTEFQC